MLPSSFNSVSSTNELAGREVSSEKVKVLSSFTSMPMTRIDANGDKVRYELFSYSLVEPYHIYKTQTKEEIDAEELALLPLKDKPAELAKAKADFLAKRILRSLTKLSCLSQLLTRPDASGVIECYINKGLNKQGLVTYGVQD